jgi:hypothetical protein
MEDSCMTDKVVATTPRDNLIDLDHERELRRRYRRRLRQLAQSLDAENLRDAEAYLLWLLEFQDLYHRVWGVAQGQSPKRSRAAD